MAYVLNALLMPTAVAAAVAPHLKGACVINLHSGVAMIPLTDDVLARFAEKAGATQHSDSMPYRLTHPLENTLVELSQMGPLLYVEAEFFGGLGEQYCVGWWEGESAVGPYDDDDAINSGLRNLGVHADTGKDEFETVGLGRCRATEDWLSQ